MTSYQSIDTPQDYVNYTFNISSRGVTEVAGEMAGLSNTVTTILGQLAFKTSEYLTHTESLVIGLGTASVAAFASSTKEAIKFEQAIANVQAIGGESINAMEIGQAAMRYSSQFGMDVNSMTEGLEALSRAGLTATNVMSGVLAEGVKLSKLEGMDLEDSINDLISTTNLLAENDIDINTQEYANAVKQMNQHIVSTSESAPINAQNIIQTLQHVGGYASANKIDQDDLFAVIAQLGAKGTKGEMAGTALRAFIAAGQKDQAQRALKRIGLSPSDLWDESGDIMLPVSEVKSILDDALEKRGYSQQEKLEFYSDFAGYKQANQIMKIDTSEVQEYKETIAQAWDLGKKLETILGTTHNNIQTLFQTVKNFMTRVGSTLLPVINAIVIPIKWGVQLLDAMPFSENITGMLLAFVGLKAAVLFINRVVPSIATLYTSFSSSEKKAKGIYGHFKNLKKELEQSKEILSNIADKEYLNKIRLKQGLMGRQSHLQHKDITQKLYENIFLRENDDALDWKELSSTQKELYYSITETLKHTDAYQDIIDQFNKSNEEHANAFIDAINGIVKEEPESNRDKNKKKNIERESSVIVKTEDYQFAAQKNMEQVSQHVDEVATSLEKLQEGTQYDIGKSILSIKEPLAEAIGRAVAQSLQAREVQVSETLGSFQINGRKAPGAIKQLQEIESEVSVDLGDIGYFLDYDVGQIDSLMAQVRGDLQRKITAYQNDNPLFINDTQIRRMEKSISGLAKTKLGTMYSAEQNSIDILDVLKYGKVKEYKNKNIGIHEQQMDAIEKALGMDNQSGVERTARLNNIHKYLRNEHQGTKAQKENLIKEVLKITEDIWLNKISHDNPGVEASKFLTSDIARYIGNKVGIAGVDWNQIDNPAQQLIEYFKDTKKGSNKDRQLKQADRLMFTFLEGEKSQGNVFNAAEAQEIGYLIRRYRQLLEARVKALDQNQQSKTFYMQDINEWVSNTNLSKYHDSTSNSWGYQKSYNSDYVNIWEEVALNNEINKFLRGKTDGSLNIRTFLKDIPEYAYGFRSTDMIKKHFSYPEDNDNNIGGTYTEKGLLTIKDVADFLVDVMYKNADKLQQNTILYRAGHLETNASNIGHLSGITSLSYGDEMASHYLNTHYTDEEKTDRRKIYDENGELIRNHNQFLMRIFSPEGIKGFQHSEIAEYTLPPNQAYLELERDEKSQTATILLIPPEVEKELNKLNIDDINNIIEILKGQIPPVIDSLSKIRNDISLNITKNANFSGIGRNRDGFIDINLNAIEDNLNVLNTTEKGILHTFMHELSHSILRHTERTTSEFAKDAIPDLNWQLSSGHTGQELIAEHEADLATLKAFQSLNIKPNDLLMKRINIIREILSDEDSLQYVNHDLVQATATDLIQNKDWIYEIINDEISSNTRIAQKLDNTTDINNIKTFALENIEQELFESVKIANNRQATKDRRAAMEKIHKKLNKETNNQKTFYMEFFDDDMLNRNATDEREYKRIADNLYKKDSTMRKGDVEKKLYNTGRTDEEINKIYKYYLDNKKRPNQQQSSSKKSNIDFTADVFNQGIEKILKKIDNLMSIDAINIQTALLDRLKISLGDKKYYEELEKLKATNEQNIRATDAGQEKEILDEIKKTNEKLEEQKQKFDRIDENLQALEENQELMTKGMIFMAEQMMGNPSKFFIPLLESNQKEYVPTLLIEADTISNITIADSDNFTNTDFSKFILPLKRIMELDGTLLIDNVDKFFVDIINKEVISNLVQYMMADFEDAIINGLLSTTIISDPDKLLSTQALTPTNKITSTPYPLSTVNPNILFLPSGAGQSFQQPFPNFMSNDEIKGALIQLLDKKINTLVDIFKQTKKHEADIKKELLNISKIITKRYNIQKHIGDTNRRFAGAKYRESIAKNQYFEPIGPIEKEPTVYKTIALTKGGQYAYEKAYRNYNYKETIGPQPTPGFIMPQYKTPIGPPEDKSDLAKLRQSQIIEEEKRRRKSQQMSQDEVKLQARIAIEEEERTKRYNKKMAQRKAINDKKAAESARRFREQNQLRNYLFNQAKEFLQNIDDSEQELIHLYKLYGTRITHNYDVIKEINQDVVKLQPPHAQNQSSIEEYKSFAPGFTQYYQYKNEKTQQQEQKQKEEEQKQKEKAQRQEQKQKEKAQKLLAQHNYIEAKRAINKIWSSTKGLRVFGGVIANNGAIQGPRYINYTEEQGPRLPSTNRDFAQAAIARLKERKALEDEQKHQEEERKRQEIIAEEYNKKLIDIVDKNFITQDSGYIPTGLPTGLQQAGVIKQQQEEKLAALSPEEKGRLEILQFYVHEKKLREKEHNAALESENEKSKIAKEEYKRILEERDIRNNILNLDKVIQKAEEDIQKEKRKNIINEKLLIDELKRRFNTGLYELTDEELELIGKGEYIKKGNSKVRADALQEKRRKEQEELNIERARQFATQYTGGYDAENKPDITEYQNKIKEEKRKQEQIEENKYIAQQQISQYSSGYDVEKIPDIDEYRYQTLLKTKPEEVLEGDTFWNHIKKMEQDATPSKIEQANAAVDRYKKHQEAIQKQMHYQTMKEVEAMDGLLIGFNKAADEAEKISKSYKNPMREKDREFWKEQDKLAENALEELEIAQQLGPGMLHTMRHQLGVDKVEKERENQKLKEEAKQYQHVKGVGVGVTGETEAGSSEALAKRVRAQYSHISGVGVNANYEGMSDVEKATMKADHRYGKVSPDRQQSRAERAERFGIKIAATKEWLTNELPNKSINKLSSMMNVKEGDEDNDLFGKTSEKLNKINTELAPFNEALFRAGEIFPPFTIAAVAMQHGMEGLTIASKALWFADQLRLVLMGEEHAATEGSIAAKMLNIVATWATANAEEGLAAARIIGQIQTWLATTAETVLAAIRAFIAGPLLLPVIAILAVIAAAIATVYFWEKQHADALKKSQEELKEATAKNNAALSQYKDLKKAREKETDVIKKQQKARKEAIALYELEASRIKKYKAIREESKIRNDTIWGEYGVRADLQKAGLGFIAGGDFESQYEKYDGTTKNIRQIKESTIGSIFNPTGATGQVVNTYDNNQMFFSMVEAYKDPLTELYDKESKLIEQYGSIDNARASQEFYDAVQEFADATGIQGETAGKMLDWLETENKVNQATKAMQAEVDVIVARADAKALAAEIGSDDFSDEGLQDAMIYAQASSIYQDAYDKLWWDWFGNTLFYILYSMLNTMSLGFGWGKETAEYAQKQEAYAEGMKELAELGVSGLAEVGENTAEHAERRNYGTESLSSYHDTPFGGAIAAMNEDLSIQSSVSDILVQENEYVNQEVQKMDKTLNQGMNQAGQSSVEGFKEGLDQHSPGAISRSVQDEMIYSENFIIQATPQLSDTSHQLGEEMSNSHQDALTMADNTQTEMDNVDKTIQDSKDTINPTAYDAGYEAGQEYGKGFKKGLEDLYKQISSPEALEKTLQDRIFVRQGYGIPEGADPNDPEVQKMQEQRRQETESKLIARGFSLPSLTSFAKREGKAAYRVAKSGGLRSLKDTSVIGRIANAAEIGITEGSLSKGAKALFAPKYGEEFGIKGAKHAVKRALGIETAETIAQAPKGRVVSAADDALGKVGAKGSKYVEKGLSKLGIESGESLTEAGTKFVARNFGDDAAKLAVKGGSKLAKMGSKALPFVGTAITAAMSIAEHNPFEKHYNEDGSEKRAGQATGEVAGEIAGALASDVIGVVGGPVAGMVAGLILEPIGEAIGGTIGWMADEVLNTKFTDAWDGFNNALGGIPGQLVDFIDQSPIGQAGHWAFDQINNLTGGWLGDTWEYVKNSSIAELTGLDQLGGALQGVGAWLFGGGEEEGKGTENIPTPDQITDEQIAELERAGMLDEYLAAYGLDKEQKGVFNDKKQKISKTHNKSETTIVIKNININTEDDPEKIKSAFMNLMIELQEQISPRQVSRTIGEPPAVSTDASTDTNNQDQAEGTDQNNPDENNNTNTNPTT